MADNIPQPPVPTYLRLHPQLPLLLRLPHQHLPHLQLPLLRLQLLLHRPQPQQHQPQPQRLLARLFPC